MRNMCFLFLTLGNSIFAVEEQQRKPAGDLANVEFDVDLDFFREKEIKAAVNSIAAMGQSLIGLEFISERYKKKLSTLADMGWRFFGYEANAYIKVKNDLNDKKLLHELIFAMVVVEKYPDEPDANAAFKKIMEEIELGKLFPNFKMLSDKGSAIGISKKFAEIFENLMSLNDHERLAIRKDLMVRGALICSDDQINSDECKGMNCCLLEMLSSIDAE